MRNNLTKRVVRRWIVSVIGIVVMSLGSAAPADPRGGSVSPEDRCAILKLDATWREAKCLAEAHISGIKQYLTDEQVTERLAACREATAEMFRSAEVDAESACTTIGDADVVNYALSVATHIATSCGTSGPPCDYRVEEGQEGAEGPGTFSTATLRNTTPHRITGTVLYQKVPIFCGKEVDSFRVGSNPSIEAGQTGGSSAGACLIHSISALMHTSDGFLIRCETYIGLATGYRKFQVVVRDGRHDCVVNRP